MLTLLSDLPIIIDSPGCYETRSGKKVLIYNIDGLGTFAARGAVFREFRGKVKPRGHHLWHVSGRANGVGPHSRDIISKCF